MKKQLSLAILYYLRFLAKIQLAKIKPVIIGVTGSAGKSSCVAAIETILKSKFRVKTTAGANSESGIPLSILDLKMTDYSPLDWLRVILLAPLSLIRNTKYKILVCEMGIDELVWPKNMEYLLTIVRPKIGVFLNVLPVHTLQMKSVENIAAEKGKLIASLPPDGTAVVNRDDLRTHIKTAAKTVYFSGDFLSAAKVVGRVFGISLATSNQQLATSFIRPPGRWSIFPGINGSILIDSSYNASPVPMLSALGLLKKEQFFKRTVLLKKSPFAIRRRIAVLGDMRELGDLEKAEHQKVATVAYELTDKVITVGPLTKKYFPQNPKLLAQFNSSYQAGEFLQTFLQPGDLVLFKGSQNTIFLETAVEMCLKNKADAAKLCRPGRFWDKQREKYKS